MGTTSVLESACEHSRAGLLLEAQAEFRGLVDAESHPSSLLLNNLAAVEAALGNIAVAQSLLERSVASEEPVAAALANQDFLQRQRDSHKSTPAADRENRNRIAIVSLLFNWPSTGGGTVHTKELADFLTRHGYDIRHYYAVNESWGVGNVTESLSYPSRPLTFDDSDWNADSIRSRFREEVRRFAPDSVIVTDSWNTKPLLCEAVAEFPYLIRIAALETLCPLNNVRLLVDDQRQPQQCELHQLREPHACFECVTQNQHLSGGLHQAERQLGGFFSDDYPDRLQKSFAKAAGVLAVNPEIAELVKLYSCNVHVVPSGFDEERFPQELLGAPPRRDKLRLLFAGLTNEFMKGFHVLRQAAELLWQERQDFEIIATADPVGPVNDFVRNIGWQSQESLPGVIRDCDMLIFPTIAQEALGRTVVEAMACGRPVIASDIGGLSWVIDEGITGLLCEPNNPADLAAKCNRLLDDQQLRDRLGTNGRQKFEQQFTWNQILKNHYLSLLGLPIINRTERSDHREAT